MRAFAFRPLISLHSDWLTGAKSKAKGKKNKKEVEELTPEEQEEMERQKVMIVWTLMVVSSSQELHVNITY